VSLGLRLVAKLSTPVHAPEQFLSKVEDWILHQYPEMLPRIRQGMVEAAPTLFCQLHPAAEEIELSLIDPEHIVVSANTTTVGPGYHIFLVSLLKKWADEFHASWDRHANSSDEYGDETEYFFSGDEPRLREEMTRWLRALAGMFFDGTFDADDKDIALCMPLNPHFSETELPAITSLGPRSWEWLRATAKDGNKGRDFFAWWGPGLNAEYYLGRALANMWTNVRWRTPVNDSERQVLKDVTDSLRSAYRLDPTLQLPWEEWKEIVELLDVDLAEKELVRSHARGIPKVGYRRRKVRVALPGGWTIQVSGSFSDFEEDENNDLSAWDPPREIWFTAFSISGKSPRKAFEDARKEIKKSKPEYLIERDSFIAQASINKKRRDSGEDYFILKSSNVAPGKRAVCTILFSQPEDREWALETWRSIRPPKPREA